MTGLDFFVDLTITGTVLGLDHTSDAAAVYEMFGAPSGPPVDSFGLIEFGWHEGQVTYFGAQVHRLPWLVRDHEVEPVLVERYGRFPDRVDLDELLKAVAEQGFPLVERPYHDEDHVDFWSPVSHMGVLAERGGRDVVKLLGPTHHSPWVSYPNQFAKFESYARHLLALTDVERSRWFDKRAEDRDWWGCLASAAARKTGGTEETARQWKALRLVVHGAATARGMCPPGQAAATEVGLLLDAGCAPDDAVRRWLATASMPAPNDVRAARSLRDQIHEVARALPWLTDAAMAAELREWHTVKPNLLAG